MWYNDYYFNGVFFKLELFLPWLDVKVLPANLNLFYFVILCILCFALAFEIGCGFVVYAHY